MSSSKAVEELREKAKNADWEISFLGPSAQIADEYDSDEFEDEQELLSRVEESQQEMAKIILHRTDDISLGSDAWATGVLMIVKDVEEICSGAAGEQTYIHMAFSGLVLLLVVTMQLSYLYWIHLYVSQPAVNHIQSSYVEYRKQCFFTNKTFNSAGCQSFDLSLKDTLCSSVIRRPYFLAAMCFTWALAILSELRVIFRKIRAAYDMPKLPDFMPPKDQCIEVKDSPHHAPMMRVYCLNSRSRLMIYVLIALPRFTILLVLLYLGLRFLVATVKAGELILNTMSLIFVLDFPTLLASATFPARLLQETENLRFQIPVDEDKQTRQKNRARADYCRSVIFLVIVTGIVFLYVFRNFNAVIPMYNGDIELMCEDDTSIRGYCKELETCFPYGR